jgi:hypothetical protein
MIAKMIRGKQEDRVDAVQDRQVVQEEEEEMKTKKWKATNRTKII